MNNTDYTDIINNVFAESDYVFAQYLKHVQHLFNFYAGSRKEKEVIPYNLLIVGDDYKQTEAFCMKILEAARKTGLFNKGFAICTMEELLSSKVSLLEIQKRDSIVVINNVSNNSFTDVRWTELAKQFEDEKQKGLIKILCINNEIAAYLKETDEHFFFRVFPHAQHVRFSEPDVENIYQQLIQKLNFNSYICTKKFCEELHEYLVTIYSKADLKGMPFINDLYARIVRSVLIRDAITKEVDESTLPAYNKNPEQESEVVTISQENIKLEKEEKICVEVPSSRIINTASSEEEQVLFFALSALSKPSMNKYQGDGYFWGISQLEPGTKNTLYRLANEGKKLNRIVIVESKETRCRNLDGIDEEFWDDKEYMRDKYKSSVCFYKQRILDYIRRDYSKKIFTDSSTLLTEAERKEDPFPDTISYSEEELKTLFYDIPTANDEELPEGVYRDDSIELFMEIIRGIKGNGEKKINLYVDVQGGARSALQQINTVLELLKEQNVEIMGRYATAYLPGSGQTALIHKVDEAYKSYELISAMTEFKKYGRGKGLTDFFVNKEDSTTKQIVEVIEKISGAIALCNVEAFEEGLKELKAIKIKINNGEDNVDSQIKIVFDDITKDYAALLEENRTTFDTVKWCTEKFYYQQAITLIESRMPGMLTQCGLLRYEPEKILKCKKYPETFTVKELCARNKNQLKQNWKHDENYLFESWIYNNQLPKNPSSENNNSDEKITYFGSRVELLGNISSHWEELIDSFSDCQNLSIKLKENGTNYYFEYPTFDSNVRGSSREKKMFRMFVALSKELKEARNEINHANSTVTEKQIRDALDTYIVLGEKLKLNQKYKQKNSILNR